MEPDTIKMDFKKLVDAIQQAHNQFSDQARRAVNTSLTLRNWLIGLHIREYEQHGADRAQYGDSQMYCASQFSGKTLISKLSFTHLVELFALEDDTKRAFYEVECIRGNWSVRELKRQIASLYYERTGLSRNKQKLSEPVPHIATGR